MNSHIGNGANLATPDQPESASCNVPGSMSGNFWASWRAWIDRLNASIDARPMSRHHRLGSWQQIKRE